MKESFGEGSIVLGGQNINFAALGLQGSQLPSSVFRQIYLSHKQKYIYTQLVCKIQMQKYLPR